MKRTARIGALTHRPAAAPAPHGATDVASAAADAYVRRARAVDLDLVAPLFDAYRQFYGRASDVAAGRRFLAARLARRESVVLLAIASARPGADDEEATPVADVEAAVGFAQLYPSFSSVSLRRTVVLNDLFVSPGHRGRGVGGRLVDAALAHARRVGALRVELATQITNDAALRVYRAKGFVADTTFAHLSAPLGTTIR